MKTLMSTVKETSQAKILAAADKYLKQTGYEILSYRREGIDIITWNEEENILSLIDVYEYSETTPNRGNITAERRRRVEQISFDFLDDHKYLSDCTLSYDQIEIMLHGPERATIKHYKNVWSNSNTDNYEEKYDSLINEIDRIIEELVDKRSNYDELIKRLRKAMDNEHN